MERWITILLTTLGGLGVGLALVDWRRGRESSGPEPGEETQPWRAVSPGAIGAVFAVTALLVVAVLALVGPDPGCRGGHPALRGGGPGPASSPRQTRESDP